MSSIRQLPCGRPLSPPATPPTAEKLSQMQSQLKGFLSAQGLKYTEQRWAIAQVILQTAGHLDAQQIVERVRVMDSAIGAATVYRSIKVLCDAGLLEKSHQNVEGRIVYELPDEDHHDHIICLDCGEIFEFHDEKIERQQEDAARTLNFNVEGHRHVIHGRCEYLKRKKS